MQTVTTHITSDYRERGSKFLGFFRPVNNQNDVEQFLEEIKSEYPDASHHCYAYRLNPNNPAEFDQDDGEPRGTAGLPILNAMRSANLVNCMIISVRYFGGTKLGKSGLIDAYGESARLCIEKANLKKVIPITRHKIVYDYRHQGIIDKLKNDYPLIELTSRYLEKVDIELGCPDDFSKRFERSLNTFIHLFDDYEKKGKSFHVEK